MIPACHYHRQWAGCGKAEQSLVLYQMQHSDRAPWYVVVVVVVYGTSTRSKITGVQDCLLGTVYTRDPWYIRSYMLYS